jgi:hypothetical protein
MVAKAFSGKSSQVRPFSGQQEEAAMIHHVSIPARDAKRVAEVLAEFMGGTARQPFEQAPDVWVAFQEDQEGTFVEVLPAGVELRPASAGGPRLGEARELGYGPFHLALSVEMSPEAIATIAKREGWECYLGGATTTRVMDVWVENATQIHLLPPAFAAEYRAYIGRMVAEPQSTLQPAL